MNVNLPLIFHSVRRIRTPGFAGAAALDAAVEDGIERGDLPGAVLIVGHEGRVVHRRAYGDREVEPAVEKMTPDTIFDIASLTKVVATTPCLMRLLEQGKFELHDPVTKFVPGFMGGRSEVTLGDLMTHFSGLKPDVPLKPEWTGYARGVDLACTFAAAGPPETEFVYSDINFILLGEIVNRLSGRALDRFASDEIFKPLGMKHTRFLPPPGWVPRIAPTTLGIPRGTVHDPTARAMGGVAGHAGAFATADDLARYAQMMLNLGELDGRRLFMADTVRLFATSQSPAGQKIERGLGWDIDSPYSSCRGKLFPIGSFGHTGFTGTSMWIDPASQSYVILLSNSVHPREGRSIVHLRAEVATIAAQALGVTGAGR